MCYLLCSLYKAHLASSGDVQGALRHLLKLPDIKPSTPAQHRPQAARQRCLMGIYAIITQANDRLYDVNSLAATRTMRQLVEQLSKKVGRTNNYLWHESKPQEVEVSLSVR